ncbi:MAG TPA: VWA domain-containing protein [Blastocatellia bacterium]|nr:VWA domain-containing protein [Blastocatellia bacterium]
MKSPVPVVTVALLLLLAGMLSSVSAQSNPPADKQKPKPPGAEPSSENETIRIDTTLVTIPVSVIDRDGKFIPHLTKRDFRLFEDGVEQEISDFASVEAPFSVVLLLDTSRSTRFRIEDIQQAAVAFVEELHPQDRVMVVSFDSDVYIDSEFTSDRNQLRRAIYGTRTGGSTRLYDAVDLVITERLRRVSGRKAVVLFTDGVDTDSRLASARSTIDRVEESGVLVYPIEYNTEGSVADPVWRRRRNDPPPIMWPGPRFPRFPGGGRGRRWPFDGMMNYQGPRGTSHADYARAAQYLRDLAERSGARLYHAETLSNLSQAFSQIAEELRHQYTLSYYPTNTRRDGSYRRVKVQTTQPGLIVRARDGYRAAGEHAADAESRQFKAQQ